MSELKPSTSMNGLMVTLGADGDVPAPASFRGEPLPEMAIEEDDLDEGIAVTGSAARYPQHFSVPHEYA